MRPINMATLCIPVALALVATACNDKGDTNGSGGDQIIDTYQPPTDMDGDGYSVDDDCDDSDANVHPGQVEECDGVDNNCNGVSDEGFADSDSDDTPDCLEDEGADPSDTRECDGIDNDGDGLIDEGYPDVDGDGIADCAYDETRDDCDGVDNDGDGTIDEGSDADGDGYTWCGTDGTDADCNDDDASIHPGATEDTGDLVDNDCDGLVDEGGWDEGDLVISEIMNNPAAVLDPVGEWFEVYNATDRDLILNGLIISSSVDGDYHQVESSEVLSVAAGEYFVFGIESDGAINGDTPVDYVYSGVVLSNESDELVLTAEGIVIDEVAWDDGATFPDPSGASMTLDPWYISDTVNDIGKYWCAATVQWDTTTDFGSPEAENELCSTFDHDGDGYSKDEGDCDDYDDSVYPGAPEVDAGKDNDCDGEIEAMPTADASYNTLTSTLYHCDALYLDGSGSYDADGATITYEWELTSAPTASDRTSADIVETTDESPVFYPDVKGNYTFTLTVNDGGTDSFPDTLTVSISERADNDDPVADAGDDQIYEEDSDCIPLSYGVSYTCPVCSTHEFELDGTDTTDADGDLIESYAWEITEGETYASITDEDTSTPTVEVADVSATYGVTTSQGVTVELTVEDCYGATDTDEVNLYYECTGT